MARSDGPFRGSVIDTSLVLVIGLGPRGWPYRGGGSGVLACRPGTSGLSMPLASSALAPIKGDSRTESTGSVDVHIR